MQGRGDHALRQHKDYPHTLNQASLFSFFLSAAANSKIFFPAPWLDGKDLEQHPVNIWYWVREQSFSPPRSCAEIQLRGSYSKPLTGKDTKYANWFFALSSSLLSFFLSVTSEANQDSHVPIVPQLPQSAMSGEKFF